jgi:hypothetical protein
MRQAHDITEEAVEVCSDLNGARVTG